MRQNLKSCAGGATLLLFAALPAWGQTFMYSEDFNDWGAMEQIGSGNYPTNAALAKGWNVTVYPNYYGENELIPQVMNTDGFSYSPNCWGAGTCYDPVWSSARTDGLGQVDYTVPWSGTPGDPAHTGRFTLQHQNWENWGRAAAAWYTGNDHLNGGPAPHAGAYPMNLKTNSLKAEFDLSIRTGSSFWCGYWGDGTNNSADGGVFAVQPVQDVSHVQYFGNWGAPLGWMGLPGFAVEFDIYPNAGDPGSAAPGDQNNHVGLDVYLKWDVEAGQFPSLQDNINGPFAASIPRLVNVCDNNQPVHATVYYNDPAHGGLGHVQVYLKVDPAMKAAGDPPVPAGQTPFSFGMDVGDPADGKLVIDACIGDWPTDNAVFGFIASTGGCNEIFAVDNMKVQTDAVAPGASCDSSSWSGGFTMGDAYNPTTINLGAPIAAAPDASSLANPGWDVTSYAALWDTFLEPGATALVPDVPHAIDQLKRSIEYAESHGLAGVTLHGEPNVNYLDVYNSTEELVPLGRQIPGVPADAENDYNAIVAKGYIYFPVTGDYSLDVASDNGFELKIGGTLVMMSRYGAWGYDPAPGGPGGQDQLHSGIYAQVHVGTAGLYPIQLIWMEEWGGANVEFYRRTGLPLVPFAYIGVSNANVLGFAGNSQGNAGLADQPLIYGQFAGASPALDLSGIDAATPPAPVVALSTTERVGDAGVATGGQVFNLKVVRILLPGGYAISNSYEDDYRQNVLGYLDNWDNQSPGATVQGINFQGNWWYWHGALPFNGSDPYLAHYFSDYGIPDRGDGYDVGQFGLRAEGFAIFPAAGSYILGLEADDDAYLRFGNQTVIQEPCCISQLVALEVAEAGTYPIRVEYAGYGPENRVKFYEMVPGVGKVAVNSSLSRIKVFQSATTGPYAYHYNHPTVIPAGRMVAPNGSGVTLGWNATAVKAPAGMVFDGSYQFGYGYGGPMGVATGLIENDIVGCFPAGSLTQGYATPLSINVETGGEFTAAKPAPQNVADDPLSMFLKPDTTPLFTAGGDAEEHFALSFTGYIEFPVAGEYVFNTNDDDGLIVWVGGQVATRYPYFSGAGENTPGFVHVDAPGIYDIRADYFEGGGGNMVELVQYLPDATTRVLLNDPFANPSPVRVKVWRTLAAGFPASTEFADPLKLPLSAKVAAIDRGGDSGFKFQTVKGKYGVGWHYPSNENWAGGGIGTGADKLRTVPEAHEMLAAAFDGVPSLNQIPDVATETTTFPTTINFPYGTTDPPVDFTFTATRTTGLLALTKGGHVFGVVSDDGNSVTMAGRTVGQTGDQHGAYTVPFYVYAPEDGLYPFTIEHVGSGGGAPPINGEGNMIAFYELVYSGTGLPAFVLVNDPANLTSSRAYVNVTSCGTPFVDVNLDSDVDESDFGIFQACFAVPALTFPCKCFDRTGSTPGVPDGAIDVTDYNYFMNCFSGPAVPWTASAGCPF